MSGWRIHHRGQWAKSFEIHGPSELTIEIDYDDVNHDAVDRDAARLVDVLNRCWDAPDEIAQIVEELGQFSGHFEPTWQQALAQIRKDDEESTQTYIRLTNRVRELEEIVATLHKTCAEYEARLGAFVSDERTHVDDAEQNT